MSELPLHRIIARDRAIRRKIREGLAHNAKLKEQGDAAYDRFQQHLRELKEMNGDSSPQNGTKPS